MDVDWNAELIDQLEWHWAHQLRPRLSGLDDDEFFWQPVPDCWTIRRTGTGDATEPPGESEYAMDAEPPSDGREPVTTIAWRLAHLIDVFGSPDLPHFGERSVHRPTGCPGTADAALRRLDRGHDAWIEDVRALGVVGLGRPQGDLSPPEYADAPLARLVLYTHVEVVHHGAEVCLLRDLYASQVGRGAPPAPRS